ncbi:VWA domain-containing protein [Paenibacillus sp. P26]|nr:VWA domain-containing protein [Paenibacillus sp. P26]
MVRVIDDLTETTGLKIALLIDTSASMKPKLQAVKEAIGDLQLSLQARLGESLMSVFHFPGNVSGEQEVEMDLGWTSDLANLSRLFYKLNMKGTTPTGPALLKVVQYMTDEAGDLHAGRTGETWGARLPAGRLLQARMGYGVTTSFDRARRRVPSSRANGIKIHTM